jgi:hypothetical protein
MDRHAIERSVAEFQRAYMDDPEFVDRCYEVPSLASVMSGAGVVGVARFIEFPSFEPERLFTLAFHPTSIEISAVGGASSLWGSMPAVYQVVGKREWGVQEGERFDPGQAWRRSAVCDPRSKVCPAPLRSWAALREASVNAGRCSTDTLDGIVYRHRLADREFQSNADWFNPELPAHAPQLALIKAYRKLLRGVGLYPE